jgi:transcription-repair coupling factor (superfamily II helicase)
VREVAVARGTARLAPLVLPTSRRIRLQRLYKEAVYKEDLEQLVLPLPRGTDSAPYLVDVLRELVPAEEPSVVSVAP